VDLVKIAITGGAGFLGYHLARGLGGEHELTLLDIAPFDPTDYPAGVRCHNADVRDEDALCHLLAGQDVVIHAAAALPLWKRRDIRAINVRGTLNVLNAARHNGVERVVYISSTAVYGVPDKHPLEETDPVQGVGPYGESKIAAERLCMGARARGLCVPIIRPKTFIGTGRLGVFQILYDWVQSGKRIPIIGSGHNRYQLLEVDDLVAAIHLAATAPAERANETFNVGASRFGTVREDVGALCAYAASGARVMATPAWAVKPALQLFEALGLSPLYKWVYGTADKDSFASTARIEAELGWQARYSNAEALIRSYQWYLDHASEIARGTGVTHRIAWDQGILKLFKGWL
jgi:nucleoside-diphosphate-sugar epimerase